MKGNLHFLFFTAAILGSTSMANAADPKIRAIDPAALYANDKDYECPLYEVEVMGEGFASRQEDLRVYLDERELNIRWEKPKKRQATRATSRALEKKGQTNGRTSPATEKAEQVEVDNPDAFGTIVREGSRLKLWINADRFSGTVGLAVGNVVHGPPAISGPPASEPVEASATPTVAPSLLAAEEPRSIMKSEEVQVTLAALSWRLRFRGLALAIAFVVLAIPVMLVKTAARSLFPGKGQWLVAALFLDKETATYSLSKFQFYLWTAVSVFGYVYLLLSRLYVQHLPGFLDIPNNLPSIVFISAATGAAALFITSARGPKGAGEESPSLADFVSSGGVVVAERFQFFVWTVVGCVVFLGLVVSQDPVEIRELPTVPEGFLQLMGISSLGYLAGKFARRPGPIIDDVITSVQNGALKLTVVGRILSEEATFKITYKAAAADGKEIDQEAFLRGNVQARIIEPDEQSKPDRTGKKLELVIPNHQPQWLRGVPKLTISNPDGQSATWPIPGAPEITSITADPALTPAPAATPSVLKLTLTGHNLAQAASFEIDAEKVTEEQLPLKGIKTTVADEGWQPPRYARELELSISVQPPVPKWFGAGSHTLTIKNPDDQSATGSFTL